MTFSHLERKADILSQYFIGSEIDLRELHDLASLAHLKRAETGDLIFEQGDPGHALMIVISGKVLILATSPAGRRLIINIIGLGEIFGEITVIDGAGRIADAEATAEYLLLERRYFMPYLDRTPKVATKLLKILCQRIRQATAELQGAGFLDLVRRLAKKLSMFMILIGKPEPTDGGVCIPVTQADPGTTQGVSRGSINKQLGASRNDDLFRAGRSRMVIVKPEMIQTMAGEIT